MDDLIGTQTPTRRIADPAEAVGLLERALPADELPAGTFLTGHAGRFMTAAAHRMPVP
ncbi:hypothetical protein [Streptomyces orinoci]|uniref:Uncharacterized protein n=1 Tax=Streptomyces orinoci TaxID=67339 RepID=A0ABV3JYY6_STRON|nr:hypothetical protein [Streptomyces orinoci]